jgi:hypothetical protein
MRMAKGGSRARSGKTTRCHVATARDYCGYDAKSFFHLGCKMWKNGPADLAWLTNQGR